MMPSSTSDQYTRDCMTSPALSLTACLTASKYRWSGVDIVSASKRRKRQRSLESMRNGLT